MKTIEDLFTLLDLEDLTLKIGDYTIQIDSRSELKERISQYKKNIEQLEDDLFLEATEDISKVLNIKEFNELLDLDSFTKEEAEKVEDMINCSSEIISNKLLDKINKLVEIYNKF